MDELIKIFETMDDYNKVDKERHLYGEVVLVLKTDLSGWFWFDAVRVGILFESIVDALPSWNKVFAGKDIVIDKDRSETDRTFIS